MAFRGSRRDEHGAAGVRAFQQRIKRADQTPIGIEIDVDRCEKSVLGDMTERRQRAKDASVRDKNIELLPALEQRWPQLIDAIALFEIELQQRRRATDCLDFIIEAFELSQRACGNDDVASSLRQSEGDGASNAARCAGDECYAAF